MSIVAETYATISEADSVLGENLPWEDTEDADDGTVIGKQTALEWATVYMDSTYNIPEQTTVSQSLINANSILANEHLSADLFTVAKNAAPEKGLSGATVKAGPVTSIKSYDANISSAWIDPFPNVTAMLLVDGFKIKKGGVNTVPMIRR